MSNVDTLLDLGDASAPPQDTNQTNPPNLLDPFDQLAPSTESLSPQKTPEQTDLLGSFDPFSSTTMSSATNGDAAIDASLSTDQVKTMEQEFDDLLGGFSSTTPTETVTNGTTDEPVVHLDEDLGESSTTDDIVTVTQKTTSVDGETVITETRTETLSDGRTLIETSSVTEQETESAIDSNGLENGGHVSSVHVGARNTQDDANTRPTNLFITNPNQPEQPCHSVEIQNTNRFSMTLASPSNLMSASAFEELVANYDELPAPKAEMDDMSDVVSPMVPQQQGHMIGDDKSQTQEIDSLDAADVTGENLTEDDVSVNLDGKQTVLIKHVQKIQVGSSDVCGEPDDGSAMTGVHGATAYQEYDRKMDGRIDSMETEAPDLENELETKDDDQTPTPTGATVIHVGMDTDLTPEQNTTIIGIPGAGTYSKRQDVNADDDPGFDPFEDSNVDEDQGKEVDVDGFCRGGPAGRSDQDIGSMLVTPPEEFGARVGPHVQCIKVSEKTGTADPDFDSMAQQYEGISADITTPDYDLPSHTTHIKVGYDQEEPTIFQREHPEGESAVNTQEQVYTKDSSRHGVYKTSISVGDEQTSKPVKSPGGAQVHILSPTKEPEEYKDADSPEKPTKKGVNIGLRSRGPVSVGVRTRGLFVSILMDVTKALDVVDSVIVQL